MNLEICLIIQRHVAAPAAAVAPGVEVDARSARRHLKADVCDLLAVDVPDAALSGPVEAVDGPLAPDHVIWQRDVLCGVGVDLVVAGEGGLVGVLDLLPRPASQHLHVGLLHRRRRVGVTIREKGRDGAGPANRPCEHAQRHKLVVGRLGLEGRRGLELGQALGAQRHVRRRRGVAVVVALDVDIAGRVDRQHGRRAGQALAFALAVAPSLRLPHAGPRTAGEVLARRLGDGGERLVGDERRDAGVLGQVAEVEEHVVGEVARLRAVGEEAVTEGVIAVGQGLGATALALALAGCGEAWDEDGQDYECCECCEWWQGRVRGPMHGVELFGRVQTTENKEKKEKNNNNRNNAVQSMGIQFQKPFSVACETRHQDIHHLSNNQHGSRTMREIENKE